MRGLPKTVVFIPLLSFAPVAQSFAGYAEIVIVDGPFCYYRLGESAVTETVQDEMGFHHGTFVNNPSVGVGGAIETDPTNTAVCFERIQSQYIELTTLGSFGSLMAGGFTVEYWLKTTDQTNHQMTFGAANTGGFLTDFLVDIACHDANEFRLYFRDDDWDRYEARFYPIDGNVNIYNDAWHHIVQVYDPSASLLSDRIIYYVDGQRQSVPVTFGGDGPLDSSDFHVPMTLGAMNLRGSVRYHLNGCLDEVIFYAYPLSTEQVMTHYQAAVAVILEVTINIDPDTLNRKSKGRYVTCYIELPENYDVGDIDVETVAITEINGNLLDPPLSAVGPTEIGDYDKDEIPDCMVKFDRQSLRDVCEAGTVELTLNCETYDGGIFQGVDSIFVIDK